MGDREEFEGNAKYTVILCLGDGAFGIVYKVASVKNDKKYALKHIFKYGPCTESEAGPSTSTAEPGTSSPPRKRAKIKPKKMVKTLREYKMLRKLGSNANITVLIDAYDHMQNGKVFPHLVFDLCDCDLTGLWATDLNISKEQHRWLTFMILSGVQYMHRQLLIHRDLKSQNIMVRLTDKIQLKIGDFGSATTFPGMTSWITDPPTFSRLYQPPEVHLGAKRYRVNADLWCAGLIIAEIKWKKPVIDQNSYDKSMGEVCGRITKQCGTEFEINKKKLETHNSYAKISALKEQIHQSVNDRRCIQEILEDTLCSPHRRATANALVVEHKARLCKANPQILKDLATELKAALDKTASDKAKPTFFEVLATDVQAALE